jgi:hypothetical protein
VLCSRSAKIGKNVGFLPKTNALPSHQSHNDHLCEKDLVVVISCGSHSTLGRMAAILEARSLSLSDLPDMTAFEL